MKSMLITVLLSAVVFSNSARVRAQEEPGPRDAHRVLQLSTAGTLLVTGALGTLTALNQPTWFGEGRCATGSPVFGEYGCHGLSTLHGLFALLSSVLYTATVTLEFAAFDWPGRDRHGSGYEALGYVHLIGMAIQPLGGLLAAVPQVIGLDHNSDFVRALRSIHLITGYAIVGTFAVATVIEL
jgi:hypothetical protein